MIHSPKLSVVNKAGPWWELQMLYTYHGVLIVERFVVGMN